MSTVRRHTCRAPLLLLGALLAALALLQTGCGIVSGGQDVVRVYSARHYGLERVFEEFSRETGISVELLFGGDAELRERIKAEGESTLADVYMTVDAGNLHLAAQEGIFQPVESEVLEAAVPEHLRDPDNLWFGLAIRARTIMYNPLLVDPQELSTYEALTDPKWRGKLCLRNSTNVYTQSLVASLIAHHGYARALEVVGGWVDNQPRFINNDVLILQTVAAGGCPVAIANHYYLARLLAENPDLPVRVFWANQEDRGVHVNVSGAGVTRYADNPDLGVKLLEWLATKGQERFVAESYEYPVNPQARPPEIVAGFGTFRPDPLNAAAYGALNARAVELMDEAGYQ